MEFPYNGNQPAPSPEQTGEGKNITKQETIICSPPWFTSSHHHDHTGWPRARSQATCRHEGAASNSVGRDGANTEIETERRRRWHREVRQWRRRRSEAQAEAGTGEGPAALLRGSAGRGRRTADAARAVGDGPVTARCSAEKPLRFCNLQRGPKSRFSLLRTKYPYFRRTPT